MNLLLLKQFSIVSAFVGAFLGLVAVIPHFFAVILLSLCVSAFIIVYFKENNLVGIINVKEGCIIGAIIGFVSFLSFSLFFLPLSMLLGWIIPSYTQGVMRYFLNSFGSFIVLISLILSVAALSALFNAFFGVATAFVYEMITGIKKENNQNNSVDFEIK